MHRAQIYAAHIHTTKMEIRNKCIQCDKKNFANGRGLPMNRPKEPRTKVNEEMHGTQKQIVLNIEEWLKRTNQLKVNIHASNIPHSCCTSNYFVISKRNTHDWTLNIRCLNTKGTHYMNHNYLHTDKFSKEVFKNGISMNEMILEFNHSNFDKWHRIHGTNASFLFG